MTGKTYDRTPAAAAAALLCVAWMPAAHALEATASVGYTGEYTSNVTRSPTEEVEDWIHRPGVQVGLTQAGTAIELDAGYDYERRIYREDLFEDENAVTGTARLEWHALPERLDIHVANTRTESTERSLVPETEANRQIVSITEAGPTLRLQPTRNGELSLAYLYTDANAENTDTDSVRHTGTLSYALELSAVNTVTLASSYRQVDFDNPVAPDLDTTLATVGFATVGNRLSYSVTGGYNRTERDLGRDTVDGPIFAFNVQWVAADTTTLEVEGSRQITDRSDTLLSGSTGFGDEVSEETDLNEVFVQTQGVVSIGRRLGNNQVSVAVAADSEDYEDAARDNDRYYATFDFSRALNPLTNLTASFIAGRREYTDEALERDEYGAQLVLDRQLTRRLSASLTGIYEEWRGEPDDYEEWRGLITLTYTLLDRR